MLGLDPSNVIDLDVFVAKADDYSFYLFESDECELYQPFCYTQDIFAAFSSILLRIYLNLRRFFFNRYFFAHLQENYQDEIKKNHCQSWIIFVSIFLARNKH